MAATILTRVDNVSFFQEDKASHTTSLFEDKTKESKPGVIRSSLDRISGFVQGFSVVQAASEKTRRISQFVIFSCVACVLFLFSLSALPMILIFPEKFAILFSLASISLHVALSCLKENFAEYLKALGENKDYSTVGAVYGISLVFTLYASIYLGSYVVVLAACGLQMASVGWLMFAMFPRGSQGVVTVFKLGLKVCPGAGYILPV